jgi:hypothetical protein
MKAAMWMPAWLAVLSLPAADPAHWPQFRGPSGSGVAAEDASPPIEFGPGKNVAWHAQSGVGHGSPCIWGDRIFLLSYDPAGKKLDTLAWDRSQGAQLWRRSLTPKEPEQVHSISNLATATPACDGDRVYSYFGSSLFYGREQGEESSEPSAAPWDRSWSRTVASDSSPAIM